MPGPGFPEAMVGPSVGTSDVISVRKKRKKYTFLKRRA
jgi:hypothetical protein